MQGDPHDHNRNPFLCRDSPSGAAPTSCCSSLFRIDIRDALIMGAEAQMLLTEPAWFCTAAVAWGSRDDEASAAAPQISCRAATDSTLRAARARHRPMTLLEARISAVLFFAAKNAENQAPPPPHPQHTHLPHTLTRGIHGSTVSCMSVAPPLQPRALVPNLTLLMLRRVCTHTE